MGGFGVHDGCRGLVFHSLHVDGIAPAIGDPAAIGRPRAPENGCRGVRRSPAPPRRPPAGPVLQRRHHVETFRPTNSRRVPSGEIAPQHCQSGSWVVIASGTPPSTCCTYRRGVPRSLRVKTTVLPSGESDGHRSVAGPTATAIRLPTAIAGSARRASVRASAPPATNAPPAAQPSQRGIPPVGAATGRRAVSGCVEVGVIPPLGVAASGSSWEQLARALPSVGRPLLQAAHDEHRERGRHAGAERKAVSAPVSMGRDHCLRRRGGEWRPARQDLVPQDAQRVDVRTVIRLRIRGRLLGRHVGRGAECQARAGE